MVRPMISSERLFNQEVDKPPKQLRIGIDLDETLFDTSSRVAEILSLEFGADLGPESVSRYWYLPDWLKSVGCAPEEEKAWINALFRDPEDRLGVYTRAELFPGAVKILNNLYEAGHQLFGLTARPPQVRAVTERRFQDLGLAWLNSSWPAGNLLMREDDYWESLTGLEFKLRLIRGDLTFGSYQFFPGLDKHLDDRLDLLTHPLAEGFAERICLVGWGLNARLLPRQNFSLLEQTLPDWPSFGAMIEATSRDKNFDPTIA